MRRRTTLLWAAALGALGAVALAAYATGEVVERGRLLPWAGPDIRRVRIFGSWDLYISSEAGRPSPDLVNSWILLATATLCFTTLLLLRPAGRQARLFTVAGIGTAFLAVDEQFAVHETIGHNLEFLADLPGIDRPDDVVVALYLLPAAVFVWRFWPIFRSSARARGFIVTALVLFVVTGIWDAAGLPLEEVIELGPSLALLASFASLASDCARGSARP